MKVLYAKSYSSTCPVTPPAPGERKKLKSLRNLFAKQKRNWAKKKKEWERERENGASWGIGEVADSVREEHGAGSHLLRLVSIYLSL